MAGVNSLLERYFRMTTVERTLNTLGQQLTHSTSLSPCEILLQVLTHPLHNTLSREELVIATKFGYIQNENLRLMSEGVFSVSSRQISLNVPTVFIACGWVSTLSNITCLFNVASSTRGNCRVLQGMLPLHPPRVYEVRDFTLPFANEHSLIQKKKRTG